MKKSPGINQICILDYIQPLRLYEFNRQSEHIVIWRPKKDKNSFNVKILSIKIPSQISHEFVHENSLLINYEV